MEEIKYLYKLEDFMKPERQPNFDKNAKPDVNFSKELELLNSITPRSKILCPPYKPLQNYIFLDKRRKNMFKKFQNKNSKAEQENKGESK